MGYGLAYWSLETRMYSGEWYHGDCIEEIVGAKAGIRGVGPDFGGTQFSPPGEPYSMVFVLECSMIYLIKILLKHIFSLCLLKCNSYYP